MREAKLIAKQMTRLDGKAEKDGMYRRKITMYRMIKTYTSLGIKLRMCIDKVLPVTDTYADREKTQLDIIEWAEERRISRTGRITKNAICRGKRRFLAAKTMSYRCV